MSEGLLAQESSEVHRPNLIHLMIKRFGDDVHRLSRSQGEAAVTQWMSKSEKFALVVEGKLFVWAPAHDRSLRRNRDLRLFDLMELTKEAQVPTYIDSYKLRDDLLFVALSSAHSQVRGLTSDGEYITFPRRYGEVDIEEAKRRGRREGAAAASVVAIVALVAKALLDNSTPPQPSVSPTSVSSVAPSASATSVPNVAPSAAPTSSAVPE